MNQTARGGGDALAGYFGDTSLDPRFLPICGSRRARGVSCFLGGPAPCGAAARERRRSSCPDSNKAAMPRPTACALARHPPRPTACDRYSAPPSRISDSHSDHLTPKVMSLDVAQIHSRFEHFYSNGRCWHWGSLRVYRDSCTRVNSFLAMSAPPRRRSCCRRRGRPRLPRTWSGPVGPEAAAQEGGGMGAVTRRAL